MAIEYRCCGTGFLFRVGILILLVLFAGLMSGLKSLISLVDLEVLAKSGTPDDRKHATKILPVMKRRRLLCCTLLICNAAAMEALPIFLDSLVSAWGAILISMTLILLFVEIITQAVFFRHGLAIGAAVAPVVQLLVWICFPVAYPISKLLALLDLWLGKEHGSLLRRLELKTLVDLQCNGVKNLLMTHPDDEVPLRNVPIPEIPRVPEIMPSDDNLNEFQKGHSHMAIIVRQLNMDQSASENLVPEVKVDVDGEFHAKKWTNGIHSEVLHLDEDPLPGLAEEAEAIGKITPEDVNEEHLQEEIYDETDHLDERHY